MAVAAAARQPRPADISITLPHDRHDTPLLSWLEINFFFATDHRDRMQMSGVESCRRATATLKSPLIQCFQGTALDLLSSLWLAVLEYNHHWIMLWNKYKLSLVFQPKFSYAIEYRYRYSVYPSSIWLFTQYNVSICCQNIYYYIFIKPLTDKTNGVATW